MPRPAPPKPPKRPAVAAPNPFGEEDEALARSPGAASRNPFAEDEDHMSGIELRYPQTNPFADATVSSGPSKPLQASPSKQRLHIPLSAIPVPSGMFSRNQRAGYNPFVTDLEDCEEEEALGAANTSSRDQISVTSPSREQAKVAEANLREQRRSSNSREKFRKSMRRLESKVDRSGEGATAHCVDDSKENTVVRFLVSKRVFGYPGSSGTLLSNYWRFVLNNHPLLSVLFLHPKNAYTRRHRCLVYLNSLFFAVFLSFVLLGTTSVRQVSMCRLGCNLDANSTTSVTSTLLNLAAASSVEERCTGGYNDGLLYSSYRDQCQYYHPWVVSLVCGLFVTLYSSLLQFFATCACMQGHRSCQVCVGLILLTAIVLANGAGRICKSCVEGCGGTTLAFCTCVSTILMAYAVLGSVVLLHSGQSIIVNTLLSKVWAAVEWFVYSLPFFSLRYPADRRHFYATQQARELRRPAETRNTLQSPV